MGFTAQTLPSAPSEQCGVCVSSVVFNSLSLSLSLSLPSPHTHTSSAAVIPQWGSTPSVATETSSSLEGGEEGADDDDNIAYRTVLVKLACSFSLPLSPPSPISLPPSLYLSPSISLSLSLSLPISLLVLSPCLLS